MKILKKSKIIFKITWKFTKDNYDYFLGNDGIWYCRGFGSWYEDNPESFLIYGKKLLKELERQYNYWKAEQKLSNRKN